MDIYLNSSDYANFLRPPGPGHPDDLPAAPDLDYYYDSAQDWVSLRSPENSKQIMEAGGAILLTSVMRTHVETASIVVRNSPP